MIGLDELLSRVRGLDRRELVHWVEQRWVVPEAHAGGWIFHEIDVARVELIVDIRRDFAIDDETMPLVLSLLDQVYSLRRQLRRLCGAVAVQPAEVQQAIRRALPRSGGDKDQGERSGRG